MPSAGLVERRQAFEEGCVCHINKPIDIATLQDDLKR